MILYTLDIKRKYKKSAIILIGISIFLIVFNFVYEHFSYGESSLYMRLMFLAPLLAAGIYFISRSGLTWLRNRASSLLLNSTVAVIVSGCLVKGIIEISGRSTTFEKPYWWVAVALFILSLVTGFVFPSQKKANN